MKMEADDFIRNSAGDNSQPNKLQTEAAAEMGSRLHVMGDRAVLVDPIPKDVVGTPVGQTDKSADMSATIFVRSKASDKEIDDTIAKIQAHEMMPLNNDEYNQKFGADPAAMERVQKFAQDNGLTVKEADNDSGKVLLEGKVGDFSKAFKVQFNDYKIDDGQIARERTGSVSVPKEIGADVQGVVGLDTTAPAQPLFRIAGDNSSISPRIPTGYMPNEVADAYDFPKESMGKGQSVAIIELGGGLDLADNAKYYQDNGFKVPEIQLVSVDGASTTADGNPHGADGEVALDSQIIGVVAPDAKQQIIFGTNDSQEQGFVDAITRAIFPKAGEEQNSAISISWGRRESKWDPQVVKTMDMVFRKAALKGITVFAAAGDTGAGDRNSGDTDDGKFVADYPASDPWVTSTGGTKLTFDSSGKAHEVVWNDNDNNFAGGGGISQIFDRPDYQSGVDMPANPNPAKADAIKDGRGVPDVAGDAATATPFRVRVDGRDLVIGGTSAVAPLYAGLMMRVNGALGRPVGFLNPFLYKNGNSGIFNDITEGDNNGFQAKPGWDATTGWGSIRGTAFLNQLRKDLNIQA